MEDKKRKQKSTRLGVWAVSCFVVVMFLGIAFGAIKLLLSDDEGSHRRKIHTVTLLKPPPPPKVKEKPPEPKVEKKEEIIEQQEEQEPEPMDEAMEDEGPMDDDLGLDAEGSAGGDSFGLRAKKGGRDIIGGTFSKANLMRKYAWYTAIIQEDLRKRVNKHMEDNGGIPKGSLTAQVKITLDSGGTITDLSVERSSGNDTMDSALYEALLMTSVEEAPPKGMPRILKLKITSKG